MPTALGATLAHAAHSCTCRVHGLSWCPLRSFARWVPGFRGVDAWLVGGVGASLRTLNDDMGALTQQRGGVFRVLHRRSKV